MTRTLPGPALLFCPANRPERYRKALGAADVVVIDLEDAVPPMARVEARRTLIANPMDPTRVIVRVNPVRSSEHEADLAALRETDYSYVMVAKTETAEDVAAFHGWRVIALCETPLGVLSASLIAAAPNTVALMWGAEDLVAAMGGRTSRRADNKYRDVARHARSTVLLAAKAYRREAIDAVYVDYLDLNGLAAEAGDAAAVGFDLKACIHPRQVEVVRAAYRSTDEDIAWAHRVVEATTDGGVTGLDGHMVDAPLIAQAERILRAASRDTDPT